MSIFWNIHTSGRNCTNQGWVNDLTWESCRMCRLRWLVPTHVRNVDFEGFVSNNNITKILMLKNWINVTVRSSMLKSWWQGWTFEGAFVDIAEKDLSNLAPSINHFPWWSSYGRKVLNSSEQTSSTFTKSTTDTMIRSLGIFRTLCKVVSFPKRKGRKGKEAKYYR